MELDPHQLIEGVVLTCFAIGAAQGFLYVRGEMALAQERIAQALNDAYAKGYVGKDILGSGLQRRHHAHLGRRRLHRRRGDRPHREPRGRAGHAPAEAAVLPGRQGPVHAADDREQRRDAVEHPVDRRSTAATPTRQIGAPTSTGMRMFAVSGHVNRPGVFEVPQGVTTFRHLFEAPEYCGGIRGRPPAQGVHPRRRLGAVVLRGAPRPARSTSPRSTRPGSMLGSGAIVVMDDTTDMVKACWRDRALLRQGELRQVHAVPRGHHVARADPAAHHRRPRPPRATSTCCSTSATTSAPGVTWPPRQTTICVLGPSAVSPIASALTPLPPRVRGLHRAAAEPAAGPAPDEDQVLADV